jgi:cytochrome c-type biogenesis protein CcmH
VSGRRIAWIACAVVVAVGLVIGATGDRGPQTNADRVNELSQRLLCPVCDGETVFDSQTAVSENIRDEIARLVADNRTDDEIVAQLRSSYGDGVVSVPPSSGLGSLVWSLPVIAAVAAAAGLTVAFRRWRRDAGGAATDDDRSLVSSALADRD